MSQCHWNTASDPQFRRGKEPQFKFLLLPLGKPRLCQLPFLEGLPFAF